jgi:dihydrofolate reductase
VSALCLVLAMSDNGVIGSKGGIPWHISDDLRRFKTLTMGKPILMGRRTWQSLPRRPLPGRTNIVITRDRTFVAVGALVAGSLEEALDKAQTDDQEVMIVGGADIYRLALPLATRVYLTEVHAEFAGDVFLEKFGPEGWQEISREEGANKDGLRYSFVTLERR